MNAQVQRQAFDDIDRRLDGLCSSEHARAQMARLAADFEAAARELGANTVEADPQDWPNEWAAPGERTATILYTAACYLRRSLERPTVDGKVLLEAVNSLCWDRYHLAAEDLPEDLLEDLDAAGPDLSQRLAVWERGPERGVQAALTDTVVWWLVAGLVTDTAHLEEGSAARTLAPLREAFAPRRGTAN